jgi:hypothetical protein
MILRAMLIGIVLAIAVAAGLIVISFLIQRRRNAKANRTMRDYVRRHYW